MMEIEELKLEDLDTKAFIEQKSEEISSIVGDSIAINALSGGVDSSAVIGLGNHICFDCANRKWKLVNALGSSYHCHRMPRTFRIAPLDCLTQWVALNQPFLYSLQDS